MRCSERFNQPKGLNAISQTVQELKSRGIKPFNASSSNPSQCALIPDKSLYDYFYSENIMFYDPEPKGSRLAREALADFYDSSADSFFLTASTSEAYSWLFKLLSNPGDYFLIPKPGYPLFDYLASQELVQTMPYQLEYVHPSGWYIDLDYLETVVDRFRPKGIILINPNNPTGSYVRYLEYEKIVSLCLEYDMCIVADEVFFPHQIDSESNQLSFMHCDTVPTFTLNGLSKLLCMPQVKQGWIHLSGINDTHIPESLELIADTFLSANVFAMSALPKLLKHISKWVDTVHERIVSNYQYAKDIFNNNTPFRPRTTEGGWSLMIEVPRLLPDDDFIIYLLKSYAMYIQPGYFFDCKESGIVVPSLILPSSDFQRCILTIQEACDSILKT